MSGCILQQPMLLLLLCFLAMILLFVSLQFLRSKEMKANTICTKHDPSEDIGHLQCLQSLETKKVLLCRATKSNVWHDNQPFENAMQNCSGHLLQKSPRNDCIQPLELPCMSLRHIFIPSNALIRWMRGRVTRPGCQRHKGGEVKLFELLVELVF